jgi:hypothetical protein
MAEHACPQHSGCALKQLLQAFRLEFAMEINRDITLLS